ncbi:putative ubiquitinyl hydrolase 1 [Rosa chinensis]|uniref:Putative ubiquitinyl hydrolase 1 n=1 Tax=Rosa chinensis TaxID=74649 RepID=A0A2P6QL64_ROSCH|nr:ubiquitin C-terminal hydrolase 12 [Rosa chinensis]PRQ34921.1 putative ubiquitinyl hydrolase 1 [Rosa chinensis]
MAGLDINHNGLVWRSVTRKPPKHYKMSIKSFSRLQSEEKYESGEFEVGGYKWKLVLFPNGNKNRDVKDHISLYLEMGGDKAIEPGKIVTVDYKLFLLNRHKGKESYLVLEDYNKREKKYCIYRTIVGGLGGLDRFIPLQDFSDASNGYLIDDRCEFGVEVFVSETTRKGKGECVFMSLNTAIYKHVWKVTNFSKLGAQPYYSLPFTANDQKYCSWRLVLYPKGLITGKDSHLSLLLYLDEPHKLPPGSKILAEFTLRILDQIHGNHRSGKVNACWFIAQPTIRACGFDQLITQEKNARFSMDDTCIIEVEITIQGLSMPRISTRPWPWNF